MSKKAKLLTGVLSVAAVLLVAFAYYYVVLPPINIHAPGFWIFVIVLAAAVENQELSHTPYPVTADLIQEAMRELESYRA